MKGLIQHNAAVLRELHQAVHRAFEHRKESAEAHDAWQAACREFFGRYDELAFPGGLSQGLEKLAAGDPMTVKTALIYIEEHPYYFRSQYNSTKITRLLKTLPLNPGLKQSLDSILEAQRQWRLRKGGRSRKLLDARREEPTG